MRTLSAFVNGVKCWKRRNLCELCITSFDNKYFFWYNAFEIKKGYAFLKKGRGNELRQE